MWIQFFFHFHHPFIYYYFLLSFFLVLSFFFLTLVTSLLLSFPQFILIFLCLFCISSSFLFFLFSSFLYYLLFFTYYITLFFLHSSFFCIHLFLYCLYLFPLFLFVSFFAFFLSHVYFFIIVFFFYYFSLLRRGKRDTYKWHTVQVSFLFQNQVYQLGGKEFDRIWSLTYMFVYIKKKKNSLANRDVPSTSMEEGRKSNRITTFFKSKNDFYSFPSQCIQIDRWF